MKTISIVVPCFNESENIVALYKAIQEVFDKKLLEKYAYTLIFVNDGSTDNSLEILKNLQKSDEKVKFIHFSRNFGHQLALKAGLDNAFSDCVISMDCDLQHPPSVIPLLIEKWEEGYHIVGTIREYPKEISAKKRKSSKLFYKLLNVISEVEIKDGTADFRLLDKKVVEVLRQIADNEPFLRGIIPWVGFKQTYICYVAHQRFSGQTKYNFKKMLSLGVVGVTSFSTKPLHFAIYLGFIFSGISLLYIPYIVYSLVKGHPISGWASLITTIVFFGGVQLCVLGIIGVYIGKIFKQTKERPNYIIEEKSL